MTASEGKWETLKPVGHLYTKNRAKESGEESKKKHVKKTKNSATPPRVQPRERGKTNRRENQHPTISGEN